MKHSVRCHSHTRQVEQKPGGRGRGREWATLGVHPLSWLLSNNRLEEVPFVSVPHTSSNRLLLSSQDKGCTPSVAHSLPLPLGPTLLNLWSMLVYKRKWKVKSQHFIVQFDAFASNITLFVEVEPPGGYSTLAWTGVCRPDLGTLTHV